MRPEPLITESDLETLERNVWTALEACDTSGLRVLGYGEITLVLGWPPEAPRVACKRLPMFPDVGRAAAYGETVTDYIEALRRRDVDMITSEWRTVTGDGDVAAYVIQPVLPVDTLVPNLLRADPTTGIEVVDRIISTIANTVDEEVGLDGQVANWAFVEGRLRYFDVTTPMLKDSAGRTRLDLGLLVRPLPAPVRSIVRRAVAPGIVAHFHEPRYVLVDMIGNLLKERLDGVVDQAIALANRYAEPPIDRHEVERFYRSDARTWEVLLQLRRADRWWYRHVRHHTYPFLLPGPIER
ncbi:MAG: DUF6206 family protein [Acidimicrobiia bacterium]